MPDLKSDKGEAVLPFPTKIRAFYADGDPRFGYDGLAAGQGDVFPRAGEMQTAGDNVNKLCLAIDFGTDVCPGCQGKIENLIVLPVDDLLGNGAAVYGLILTADGKHDSFSFFHHSATLFIFQLPRSHFRISGTVPPGPRHH